MERFLANGNHCYLGIFFAGRIREDRPLALARERLMNLLLNRYSQESTEEELLHRD